jgi:hypothetical protein
MTSSSKEINKAMGDAVTALTDLEERLTSSDYEADYIPRETVVKANTALRVLDKMLSLTPVKDLQGRGSILTVMDKIGPKLDDPATQTMLGTSAVEFSGIFHSVHNRLTQKDSKKVEGTLFGRLDKE